MKPIPARRPFNPDRLRRDIHIQFTIEILREVGVRPTGTSVSGCRIVAGVVELSEDSVKRIWKECPWRTSYLPTMRKYSKAIAIRSGLYQPTQA